MPDRVRHDNRGFTLVIAGSMAVIAGLIRNPTRNMSLRTRSAIQCAQTCEPFVWLTTGQAQGERIDPLQKPAWHVVTTSRQGPLREPVSDEQKPRAGGGDRQGAAPWMHLVCQLGVHFVRVWCHLADPDQRNDGNDDRTQRGPQNALRDYEIFQALDSEGLLKDLVFHGGTALLVD